MDAAVPPGESSDNRASGLDGWGEGCCEGPSDRKLLPAPKHGCEWVWAGDGSMLEPCWLLMGPAEDWEAGGTWTLGRRDLPALWEGLYLHCKPRFSQRGQLGRSLVHFTLAR